MFIIDDILLAPIKGLFWVFKEIYKRVEEEMAETPEKLKTELLEFQKLLEASKISEKEYAKREKDILQRLNALRKKS